MRKFLTLAASVAFLAATPAYATTWTIGDDDGYGAGIPDNSDHPFSPVYDGRSAAEAVATDGAQFTDTYSTAHPGYSPQSGTVATFIFSGLGTGWTQGTMIFDLADFQAGTFGALLVQFNGITQNWAFDDGYPHTAVHYFNLDQNVLDTINSLGSLTITMDRNGSGDFYGVDYATLSNQIEGPNSVPEPATWAMMVLGFGAVGYATRRKRKLASVFAA
jgi:PEP-CTERM motif